jgi:hypothetical protein
MLATLLPGMCQPTFRASKLVIRLAFDRYFARITIQLTCMASAAAAAGRKDTTHS